MVRLYEMFSMEIKLKHLLNQALGYLAKRDHTIHEMEVFLKKRNASSSEIKEIITKLVNLKFLDDEKYAAKWLEERKLLHPRSYYLIRLELVKKGITREVLDKIFLSGNEEKNSSEKEMAKKELSKFIKRTLNYPMEKRREKVLRHLSSRGFSWDVIKDAIDEYFQKE